MGSIVCIVNIVRNLTFVYYEKKSTNNNIFSLLLFSSITIILSIIFYTAPIDLVPCLLSLFGLLAYWSPTTKTLRILNILCSFCYIVYAVYLKSYFTILCELILIMTTLIGLFKHDYKAKITKNQSMYITLFYKLHQHLLDYIKPFLFYNKKPTLYHHTKSATIHHHMVQILRSSSLSLKAYEFSFLFQ